MKGKIFVLVSLVSLQFLSMSFHPSFHSSLLKKKRVSVAEKENVIPISDFSPPIVEITSPQGGKRITSNEITLTFRVSDNKEIKNITIQVDALVVKTLPKKTRRCTVKIDEEGVHTVSVVAYDEARNIGLDSIHIKRENIFWNYIYFALLTTTILLGGIFLYLGIKEWKKV